MREWLVCVYESCWMRNGLFVIFWCGGFLLVLFGVGKRANYGSRSLVVAPCF